MPEKIIHRFNPETGEPEYLESAPLSESELTPELSLPERTLLIPGVGAEDIEPLTEEEAEKYLLDEIDGDEPLLVGGHPDLQTKLHDTLLEEALNRIDGDESAEETVPNAELVDDTHKVVTEKKPEPILNKKQLEKQLKQEGYIRMITVAPDLVEKTKHKLIESLNALVKRDREVREITFGDMVEIWIK